MPRKKPKARRKKKNPLEGVGRKGIDILGAYRKNVHKGVPVCSISLAHIPKRLKRRFNAAIQLTQDTQRGAVMRFMEAYVRNVEKKFDVNLDLAMPEE